MTATAHQYLDKDSELALGVLIQKRNKAIKQLAGKRKLADSTRIRLEAEIATGEAAREELARANMDLVWSIAKQFKSKYPVGPEIEDLAQEGMTGLMQAVDKYDPDRENKFSTVAYYWIFQAIARGVNRTGRLVRLPENRITDFIEVNRIQRRYAESDLTQGQIDDKIKEEIGLTDIQLLNIRNAAGTHTSLNKPMGEDGKELGDVLSEDNPAMGSESAVINIECLRALSGSMELLDPMTKRIVTAHFKLNPDEKPAEIRSKENLTPSRYRKILAMGLDELKKSLSSMDYSLDDFIGN